MSEATDLSFVTTDELINELMNRHINLVIVREMESKGDDQRRDTLCDYKGSFNACIGMTYRARKWLMLRVGEKLGED